MSMTWAEAARAAHDTGEDVEVDDVECDEEAAA